MWITRRFRFEAAHRIENYHGKPEPLHGHSYHLEVTVEAPVGEDGLAFDFVDVKAVVRERVLSRLDHAFLNDVVGPQSTAENLAIWAWRELERHLPLREVRVYETPDAWATYRGPDAEEDLRRSL